MKAEVGLRIIAAMISDGYLEAPMVRDLERSAGPTSPEVAGLFGHMKVMPLKLTPKGAEAVALLMHKENLRSAFNPRCEHDYGTAHHPRACLICGEVQN